MKEDLIQIRSSLVIKSHTVLGDLLTILLVISIYKSQSTNNACQSIQLHLQIRAGTIVPSLLVFVLVFTTSTVWFGLSCWKTKRWPRSSFAADCLSCALSSSHILLHDSFLDKIPSSRHTEAAPQHDVWLQGWCPLGCVVFVTRALQFHLIWSKSIFAACTIFLRVLLRLLQSGFFLVCSPLLIPSLAKSRVLAVVPRSWEHLLLVSFPESLKLFTSSSTVFYLCAVWFSLSFSIILLMPVLKPSDNFV